MLNRKQIHGGESAACCGFLGRAVPRCRRLSLSELFFSGFSESSAGTPPPPRPAGSSEYHKMNFGQKSTTAARIGSSADDRQPSIFMITK